MRLHEYVLMMLANCVASKPPIGSTNYSGTPLKSLGPFPSGSATRQQRNIRGPDLGKGTRKQRRMARQL